METTTPATASEPSWSQLPDDIALAVISLLEVTDVCALGSCSRFWRGLCDGDDVWAHLYRHRWPETEAGGNGEEGSSEATVDEGWKARYIIRHNRIAVDISSVIEYVQKSSPNGSLESGYYLKAINDLGLLKVGFNDVQFFLFTRKLNVLLNLIGLHYAIVWLRLPHDYVREALIVNQVAERQVSVSLFKLGRWFYGFRLRDEHELYQVSLADLTTTKEEEVLVILNRGAVHEVFRVQISSAVTKNEQKIA